MSVRDTIQTPKRLVDPEQTQRSLIALRDELEARGDRDTETLLKINSCLYREYPRR